MANIDYFGPLHNYQRRAVEAVLVENSPALFLEAGLGKTLASLEIIYQIRKQYGDIKTLVIAPLMICETVWAQENEKWGYPMIVKQIDGDPVRRLKIIRAREADIYLITPDNIPWLNNVGEFPWDVVIIDELTKFKSSTSQRWRQARQLFKRRPGRYLGLTGTPVPNGYYDLWAQLCILDSGKCLGAYKGEWEESYFRDVSIDPRKYNNWVLRRGAKELIQERLKNAGVISMRAEEVLGQKAPIVLPSIRINMPKVARDIYKELENDMMATMPDDTDVLLEHPTTLSIKLRQVCSGFMYDEDGKIHRLHDEKMKATKEFIESMAGEPVMIVYTYEPELMQLQSLFPTAPNLGGGVNKADRIEALRAWNAGELPVLLVQPQAAGHGVNAQEGGHQMLFYSCDWNLETYEQVIARLNRQGQKSTVFLRHMVGGVVEDNIIRRLNEKSKLQLGLMKDLHDV